MTVLNISRSRISRVLTAGIMAAALAGFTAQQVFAVAPANISYQGTLRKSGILHTGSVPMEFRITSAGGVTVYWTSGSTAVYVNGGLFRYPLGTPNETQFAAIPWAGITPYVQVSLDGNWLQPEPLFASAYALHSLTAESASGSFPVPAMGTQAP